MPSTSLNIWQTERIPRIAAFEKQCAAVTALAAHNPQLEDENHRGLIMLLSAHFQGFCRDLYTECAVILSTKIMNPSIRVLFQQQFTAGRKLDMGNPNLENIRKDFQRFGFVLDLGAADPANGPRITHLGELNKIRNVAAHHGRVPPGGIPDLPTIQSWRISCGGLATSIDSVMYNQVSSVLKRAPWKP
jgi:hypothetical protein